MDEETDTKNTISRRKNHTKRKPTEPERKETIGREEHSSRSSSSKETNTHTSRNEPATGSQMMAAAVGEKHEVVEVEVESSSLLDDKGVEEMEDGGGRRS